MHAHARSCSAAVRLGPLMPMNLEQFAPFGWPPQPPRQVCAAAQLPGRYLDHKCSRCCCLLITAACIFRCLRCRFELYRGYLASLLERDSEAGVVLAATPELLVQSDPWQHPLVQRLLDEVRGGWIWIVNGYDDQQPLRNLAATVLLDIPRAAHAERGGVHESGYLGRQAGGNMGVGELSCFPTAPFLLLMRAYTAWRSAQH